MRLPRPQFTVRWMMILVAIVDLIAGGWVEVRRLQRFSVDFAERAKQLRYRAARLSPGLKLTQDEWVAERRAAAKWNREYHDTGLSMWQVGTPPPPEVCRIMAAHWSRLEEKYRQAARFPWLPVEPDPRTPDPKWNEPE